MRELRTIDLFSGAGGLALGFQLADCGFEPIFAVEIEHAAARTFKANFGCEVLDEPIQHVEVFPDAEVIIRGARCPRRSTRQRHTGRGPVPGPSTS
jgi:DNA (cytosine-5)-methyltransferase 1